MGTAIIRAMSHQGSAEGVGAVGVGLGVGVGAGVGAETTSILLLAEAFKRGTYTTISTVANSGASDANTETSPDTPTGLLDMAKPNVPPPKYASSV